MEITRDDIAVYTELDDSGRPKGYATWFKNDIPKITQNPKKRKTDFAEGFAQVCEYISVEEALLKNKKI